MNAGAGGGRGGLFGGHGLQPADAGRLGGWLEGRGARLLGGDSRCLIWAIGTPFGGLTGIGGAAVDPASPDRHPPDLHPPAPQLWLLGEVYDWPPDGREPAGRRWQDWLLAAWQRVGPPALGDLVGQFALVGWDAARRELTLFRDGTSTQTLYYARRPDGALLFSDRLDLLTACPLLTPQVAATGLHEYLRMLDISAPNTIVAGVAAVEPEQFVMLGRHGLHCTTLPIPTPLPIPIPITGPAPAHADPAPPTTLDAAADALEARLTEAVAKRMPPTGDTLVFLSGGVDSACLCAMAAAIAPGRVVALTVGFVEPGADESGLATAIAARLGVRHQVLRFDLDTYRAAFDRLAAEAEYPFADPAAAATLLSFEHGRGLAGVALDGTGADTLLGLMPARHQRLAIDYAAWLPYPLRHGLARLIAPVPVLRDYRALLDFGDPEELLLRWQGFPRRGIERLCGTPVSLAQTRPYRVFRSFPRGAHFERYSALLGNLPDDRLHVAAALTGLRVRLPFCDPTVRNLVGLLDRDLCWRPDEPKRVLKAVLARHLPRALWDVPKHGFDFPFDALLAHRDFDLVRTWLAPARVAASGLLDAPAVTALAARYLAGERRERFRVWGLVVLFAWLDRHRW